MKWNIILFHGLIVIFQLILIEARCVSRHGSTSRHMWRQLRQPLPTETSSCYRLQTSEKNAKVAEINRTAATTSQQPPILTLADYVYQCGKRQTNECNPPNKEEHESSNEDKQQMAIIKMVDLDMR